MEKSPAYNPIKYGLFKTNNYSEVGAMKPGLSPPVKYFY